jgi:hypothetical protein
MSLRVALVDHADQHDRLRALAAALPSEWIVLDGLSPAEAIDQADVGGLDAVICSADPGPMDGATLLARVQAAHPEALRVLALPTGVDPRLGERLAAHPAVQQVLSAPYDAAAVRTAARRLLIVRSLLRDAALRAELGRVDRLPGSPAAYLGLRMVMADDSADLDEAVAALKRDPALAARVLRTANSAMYARGRPINSLDQAVSRLGLQTILQLVLASEVFARLPGADAAQAEGLGLRAAQLAARIAGTPREAALAGSAAVLADLGALLPGSVLNAPPHPGELWQSAPRVALLGAGLMALWGLPMEMVEAVAYHHRPGRLPGRGLDVVGTLHLARALAGAIELDADWVASAGLAARLEGWRDLAARLPA